MIRLLALATLFILAMVAMFENALAQDFELPPDIPAEDTVASNSDLLPSSMLFDGFTLSTEGRLLRLEDNDGDANWLGRLSVGLFGRKPLSETLSLLANIYARGTVRDDDAFKISDDVRIETRELALSWVVQPSFVVEAGRVNIRAGVASGFNPTDRFRIDSLVVDDSLDVTDRREDRLGVLVADAAYQLEDGLLQLGFRPAIKAGDDTIWADADVIGLSLDRTNPDNLLFAKFSPETSGNLFLTGSLYLERRESGVGLEASAAASDSVVVYSEAFIQRRRNLSSAGSSAGVDDANLDDVGFDDGRSIQTQTATGVSWSLPSWLVGQENITLALEHHYNQAGLSGDGLDALDGTPPGFAGPIFAEAARLQEPLARHSFFTRFSWTDMVDDVDLSAIAFVEPYDGSGQAQLSIDIALNERSTLGMRAQTSWGAEDSAFGSNPISSSLQVFYGIVF